jgi:pimeloyl-ACP methyl ester carboxylesterase/DNA-binding CsgD family transcriptional regulator
MAEQSIQFTAVDGRQVAWSVVGEGPPLVLGGWWMSHLEMNWRDPSFRAFVEALGRHRTVVRYDAPGTGLSDRSQPPSTSLDDQVAVLAGVIDAVGAESADLFAASSGGPVTTAYAVAHPHRVRRLVEYGTYASGPEIADADARESIVGVVRGHWGVGSRVLTDVFMPEASPAARRAFVEFQRRSASAELAARALECIYAFDVSDRLGQVQAPALVLHRRGDRAIPYRLGQDLATRIPGATFVALEGSDHFPWLGRTGETLRAALEGLGVDPAELDLEPDAEVESAADAAAVAEADLSPRELEVLRLVALGLSDREIADQLVLSPHTVHRHVANIRTKLRLPSRAAAAAQAARLGLI